MSYLNSVCVLLTNRTQKKMQTMVDFKVKESKEEYIQLKENLKMFSPLKNIEDYKINLEDILKDLNMGFRLRFNKLKEKYNLLCSKLELCSTQSVLKKGYSVILYKGKKIKSVKKLKNNEHIKIVFSDGAVECKISDIKKL